MRTGLWACCVLSAAAVLAGAGDNKWTGIGPNGGCIIEFAFHPRLDRLVFASSTGGLFRSTDAGLKWKRIADFGGWNGDCAHVLIHRKDDTKILVAYGRRIYASSNWGDSWQEFSSSPLPSALQHAAFHPDNPAILYGMTTDHGIYKTSDGGRTWIPKNTGIDIPAYPCCQVPQIEVDPLDGGIVYALLAGARAYRSTNGGESWKEISGGLDIGELSYSLAIDPHTPSTLYAGGDGICKTTSSGSTWTRLTGSGGLSVSVDARHPSVLYSSNYPGVFKTIDGGTTWSDVQVDPWRTVSVAVHPSRSNLVFVGGYYQGVFRSTNAGSSWRKENAGVDSEYMKSILRSGPPVDKLFAAAFEALVVSADDGKTWKPSSIMDEIGRGLIVFDAQVHPRDPRLIVLVVHNWGRMGIALSRDGGETWKLQPTLTSECGGSYPHTLALDPLQKGTLYFCPRLGCEGETKGMGVAKTTDQGLTWRYVNKGLSDKEVNTLCTDPRTGSVLYAGTTNGLLFASTNGGEKWENRSTGLASTGRIYRIVVNPSESNEIYIATDGGVFKSTDRGRSWKRVISIGGMEFVRFDPSNPRTVFAGGWGGLFVSTDDGENWSAFDSTGLGPFGIHELLLDSADPHQFLVATDRGVFSYTIKAASGGPVIQQISPAAGLAGETLTVNGSSFGPLQGDSKVLFGTLDAGPTQSWSETSIKVKVPTGVRTGYVTITVLGKMSNPFEFVVLPASGNIEPTSGPASGGTRVTILAPAGFSGTQFNVLFGAALATNIRFMQPNIVTCDSPPGTGTVDVELTTGTTVAKVGTYTYE